MNHVKNFHLYIFYALPIFIISGPFLSDLSIIIIDLWFLYKIFKNREYLIYIYNKFFISFLIFNFYLVFSSLISDNLIFSLKSSIFYLRFYIFAFAIWFIFENYKFSLKYFFFSVCFAILLIILSSFFDLVFIKNFFMDIKPSEGDVPRVSGFFGSELIMGGVLKNFFFIFLSIIVYLKYYKLKFINNFLIIFILFIFTFTIFISGERSAVFQFGLFCLISGFLLRKKINFYKIFFIIITLTSIVFISFESVSNRIITQTFEQITGNENLHDNNGNQLKLDKNKFIYLSIAHDAHARTALKMFMSKPLFGHGPNSFRKVCGNYKYNDFSCTTHPHNFYLQLLAETGLVGFLFLTYFLIFLLYQIYKNKFSNKLALHITIVYFLIYFIPIIPSGNFFNNFLNISLYINVGIYLFYRNNKLLQR